MAAARAPCPASPAGQEDWAQSLWCEHGWALDGSTVAAMAASVLVVSLVARLLG